MENLQKWWNLLGHSIQARAEQLATEVQHRRDKGFEIFPPQNQIFRALELTPPEDVKVVILGQDPYHTPGMANGLAFSVPNGVKIPPSLRNIKKEVESSTGAKCSEMAGDLSSWARQGVLLLNTVLTVDKGCPNSHSLLGWQEVTNEVLYACMRLRQPVVFLCWGKPAWGLAKDCSASFSTEALAKKAFITTTHPSPLSATKKANYAEAFIGSNCFQRANNILANDFHVDPVNWAII